MKIFGLKYKDNKAITLIALVITIVVLLVIASVAINLSIGQNGIFKRAKQASGLTGYQLAKERIDLKLVNIKIECMEKGIDYDLKQVEQAFYEEEEFTIVAYYEKTARVGRNTTRNTAKVTDIVVIYNEEPEFGFLISDTGEVSGVTEVDDIEGITTPQEAIQTPQEFEKENFGQVVTTSSVGAGTNEKSEPLYIFNNAKVEGYTWTDGTYDKVLNVDTGTYVTLNRNSYPGFYQISQNANSISYNGTYNNYIYCNEKIQNKYSKLKIKLTFEGDGRDWSKINVYLRDSTSHNDSTHMIPQEGEYYVYHYLTNSDNANYATENIMELDLSSIPKTVEDYYFYIHTAGSNWTISQIWFE